MKRFSAWQPRQGEKRGGRLAGVRGWAMLLGALAVPMLQASITWIVGAETPVESAKVADALSAVLHEGVEVVSKNTQYLSAWANDPANEQERERLLAADTLLISPSGVESDALFFLALRALVSQREARLSRPIVLPIQAPVYRMNGVCDQAALRRVVRTALSAHCDFIPFPRIWQQVYTDDHFYNGKVPKGSATESYLIAASVALAVRGEKAKIAPLNGVHSEVAEALLDSVRKGYDSKDGVAYLAQKMPLEGFPQLRGQALEVILYDGTFEHVLADWLQRFAQADGRTIVFHYTTDANLRSKLPGLFRTSAPAPNLPKVCTYTRPAWKDDTGLAELEHLAEILKADADKPNWMPFPLAVAEWARRLTGKPVYEGTRPTPAAAAMFAAMLYLEWTGSSAMPSGLSPDETVAVGIGLDVMFASRLRQALPNAIFCVPRGKNRYAFSLWRKPAGKVTLSLDVLNAPGWKVDRKRLVFRPEDFFAAQTVSLERSDDPLQPPLAVFEKGKSAEAPLLIWKIPAKDFPGQNSGLREVTLPKGRP